MCGLWPLVVAVGDAVATCVVLFGVFATSLASTDSALNLNDDTRCYCNEAACVSTGYMCKSARLGACFSQLSRDGATNIRSTHGCVESLPEIDYSACTRDPDEHVMSGAPDGRPVLICCKSDMCNYMDSVGINGFFSKRQDGNPIASAATKRTHDSRHNSHQTNSSEHRGRGADASPSVDEIRGDDLGMTGAALWLRVSIIAVPVIGVALLVPLIVVAVRLLTTDRRSDRRHWLLASHVNPASSGATLDRQCEQFRKPCTGWCECDNRQCLVQIDDVEKTSHAELAPSLHHHHFVMAAIHGGTSAGRHGYEQIRTHVVSARGFSRPVRTVPTHSLGSTTIRCSDDDTESDKRSRIVNALTV